jgi:hypothetical protein
MPLSCGQLGGVQSAATCAYMIGDERDLSDPNTLPGLLLHLFYFVMQLIYAKQLQRFVLLTQSQRRADMFLPHQVTTIYKVRSDHSWQSSSCLKRVR